MGSAHANLPQVLPTLAAGALAAVYDGQDDGLALAAVAPQAEEPDRRVGVQPVAAALAHRLQVGLLSRRKKTRGSGVRQELDEVAQREASERKAALTKKPRNLRRTQQVVHASHHLYEALPLRQTLTRKSQRQKHFASR